MVTKLSVISLLCPKFLIVLACGILFVLALLGVHGLAIAMIVVGFQKMNSCPLQSMLPVWMVVDGFVNMLLFMVVVANIIAFYPWYATV